MTLRPLTARAGRIPTRPWFRACTPLAGLLALGLTVRSLLEPSGELAAESRGTIFDADADGLSDAQEWVLQSSPLDADTDRDGYSDSEELARGSCASAPTDVPLPTDIDLALTARGDAGELHVVVAAYYTDGTAANKQLEFGALIGEDMVIEVPSTHLMHDARVSVTPALSGVGHIMVVDFEIPTGWIYQLGHLTLFSTLSLDGQGYVAAAGVLDFFVTPDGVIMQSGPWNGPLMGQRGGGTGGLYQPIPPGGDLPIGWLPGRICQQKSETVGYSNGIVTTRVTEAECVDGWDSYCHPVECKGSIGDEYTTIDPLGLIGG